MTDEIFFALARWVVWIEIIDILFLGLNSIGTEHEYVLHIL